MRLVRCTQIRIESILYQWISYNISIESSVYYNGSNGRYLYRSNIGTYKEQWQLYNNENNTYYTLSMNDINIGSCIHTNISIENVIIPKYTNDNLNEMNYNENKDKYGVTAVLFAATSSIFLLFIFIAILIKKYVLDSEESNVCTQQKINKNVNKVNKLKKKSSSNKLQIKVTTPKLKQSTLSINIEFGFSSDDDNGGPVRKLTLSPRSYRSDSKYADILPPTKPPPIGMKPVLTAKQQSNRPLPLTPPARRGLNRKYTV